MAGEKLDSYEILAPTSQEAPADPEEALRKGPAATCQSLGNRRITCVDSVRKSANRKLVMVRMISMVGRTQRAVS
jgi:hypothetical protein